MSMPFLTVVYHSISSSNHNGRDGKTYNARYEGKPETGIYKGARFGIFSEKKPEAIIDGDTTERILVDYPRIWQNILTIKKHGRLKEAYAVHAEGNVEDMAKRYNVNVPVADVAGAVAESSQSSDLTYLRETLDTLNAILANGIGVKMHGDDGLEQSLAKQQRFNARNHVE